MTKFIPGNQKLVTIIKYFNVIHNTNRPKEKSPMITSTNAENPLIKLNAHPSKLLRNRLDEYFLDHYFNHVILVSVFWGFDIWVFAEFRGTNPARVSKFLDIVINLPATPPPLLGSHIPGHHPPPITPEPIKRQAETVLKLKGPSKPLTLAILSLLAWPPTFFPWKLR